MLAIVDTALIRRYVEEINYIYNLKNKSFYFYPGEGDNVVLARVKRNSTDDKYAVSFILPLESMSGRISEEDEKIVLKYITDEDNFYGEKFYAYDFYTNKLIFDITEGLPINRTWWYMHPTEIAGSTFLTYYSTKSKDIIINKLVFIDNKPEIVSILSGQILARFLLAPKVVTEFGATIAFLAGCLDEGVPPKKEDYVKLVDYISPGHKQESEVKRLGVSTKRLDEVLATKLNKKEPPKEIIKQIYLSELIKNGTIPFNVLPVTIILDEYLKKQLNLNIKTVKIVRGKLHFSIDDLELFKSDKVVNVLKEIRDLTGFEEISIAYSTEHL